jgi:16S rRNA C1402 N4-methylase RsmH
LDEELKIKNLPKGIKEALLAMIEVKKQGYGMVSISFHTTNDGKVKSTIEMTFKRQISD